MEASEARPAWSILIVEDDQEAAEITRRMIAMQFPEATVYSAENGRAGEELYRKHTPDIVVTDISMPTQDGIEMARAIKSLKADAKFIVLTAYSDRIYLEQFREIGFYAYFLKPVDVDQLMTAIGECIAQIRRQRAHAP